MGTYYISLSMAGTVSAGTYTAGSLIELNLWLEKWYKAKKDNLPINLTAQIDYGGYVKGQIITINPEEIPKHDVKIQSLTGASGGGVTAALYLIGLIKGDIEKYVKGTWLNFDIAEMLSVDDLSNGKLLSLLNIKPIENVKENLSKITWDANKARDIEYLEDTVELFQTLTAYEPIPYKMTNYQNTYSSVFVNHFDYVRFGFHKNSLIDDESGPYRHNLVVNIGQNIKTDSAWSKLLETTPATGAFPIAFQPRRIERIMKEYKGKLFYLDYVFPRANPKHSTRMPEWEENNELEKRFVMTYLDGGAFNREPHDLARASLLQFLNAKKIIDQDYLPNEGKNAIASVILIDPFPTSIEKRAAGNQSKDIPTLIKQAVPVINALMNQGRFHPEWLEKILDEDNYSRFMIAPSRKGAKEASDEVLSGKEFNAFAGFMDKAFRFHDYEFGHYNTYRFLSKHFVLPIDNKIVNYAAGTISKATKDKYIALGWVIEEKDQTFCQIIPQFTEPGNLQTEMPVRNKMTRESWQEIERLSGDRVKGILKSTLPVPSIIVDFAWRCLFKKGFIRKLNDVAKKLEELNLLEK